MTYLLDTNACIALINGRPEAVRRRFERASSAGERLATSSIVLFELWYRVAKSQRSKANTERVAAFLAGPLEVFDFTVEDAVHEGRVQAALESVGKPIGAYDLLIAGQATQPEGDTCYHELVRVLEDSRPPTAGLGEYVR